MSPELEDKLCKAYPKIFTHHHLHSGPMFWGFECCDGWYSLINDLCKAIQNYIDEKLQKGEEIIQLQAAQVKEKFGTLRFYATGGDSHTNFLIDNAEILSARICEITGEPGELCVDSGGWYRTLSSEKAKELKYYSIKGLKEEK